ncbi:hypothetical protein PO909_029982 [Leuciscus waleckii]
MASDEDLLEKSLNELVEADLKKFKWHLQNDHECITKKDMEKADILDTVDKMAACFGPEEAVKITVEILRKMNQNNLAEQLENKHKQHKVTGNMKTSVAVGAHSKQIYVYFLYMETRKYQSKQQLQGQEQQQMLYKYI